MMISYRTIDFTGLWTKIEERQFQYNNFINRIKSQAIRSRFGKNNIELIIGPRQSGKTTILFYLIYLLQKKHNIEQNRIFYINLDSFFDFQEFENPLMFLHNLGKFYSPNKRIFLFIDEIQRLTNPGKFLKGLYDKNQNIKIFVTGSSSLEIKAKVKEYLTGRKRETVVLPISFNEYIAGKGNLNNLPVSINTGNIKEWELTEQTFGKYLTSEMNLFANYGSYPAVLLNDEINGKLEDLSEIYNSYIKNDIIDFMNIGNVSIYNKLVKALALQIGNLLSKSEICSLIGGNMVTVSKYLTILHETFVVYHLPPFLSNHRNEIKSSNKIFFIDNGIRNYSINQFSELNLRTDAGALIENLVFSELIKNKKITEELFFWRTKSGAEVDFVVQRKNEILPIEVKIGSAKNRTLSRSFHSFLQKFKPKRAIYLNKDYFDFKIINETTVYFIPTQWFLLLGTDILE